MASPAPTMDWQVDTSRSEIAFVARHLVSTVHGHFRRWNAVVHVDEHDPTRSFIRATIETSSLDTGHAERDAHLGDLFEVARHPTATFESTRIVPTNDRLEIVGALVLHGVTREVVVKVNATHHEGGVTYEGKTAISRKDFGLLWSAPVEWTSGVSDRVEIALRLEVVPR